MEGLGRLGILGHRPAQGTSICVKVTGNQKHLGTYKHARKKLRHLHLVVKILVLPTPSVEFLPCLQTKKLVRLSQELSHVIFRSDILQWLLTLEQKPSFSVGCGVPTSLASPPTPSSGVPSNHAGCSTAPDILPTAISTYSVKAFLFPALCMSNPELPYSSVQLALPCVCPAAP